MTPKDKAKELIDKFNFSIDHNTKVYTIYQNVDESKRCALIAVDEIIDAIDWHEFETPNKEINYWLDVRKEINNLL